MALPWPAQMIAEARRLWEVEGYSASQVAQALDRDHRFATSRSAICGLAHRQGWSARKLQLNRVSAPKKERVVRLVAPRTKPAPLPKLTLVPSPSPPVPTPIERQGVSFFDHREGQCRWPLWSLGTPFEAKRFCGEPAPGPGPYCAYCRTLSYEPARSAA
ncbi:conserved hypothetical protein [Bosea sp. 62]|uniref:GcrA family cell cycle regulator n=2 Tax=unclassified Bosea (in: a-proteobacteria) TaxID=2653178 RepID=UPI00125926D7|nr:MULTISPECIES: GcrA family cell cycle regulator [unclassified Bosea (in: a-proteobacteria)]CAD5254200.1 conserved hypothetical protein [Bosea sp. 7B]CAD5278004.1 conserved hypothetical protein [Bosea sp. 46]VVT59831.1 conserved hypothetical protein [Bosea sp. EC-HK365B]VXC06624.1 conserved hypothetical protein [Bosea sp. 127]VXC23994.1 conserved hypothetical protein [Bosea sp. 29B]VXC75946.1 conserved hypothetical protein [Bosea sp. 125]